MRLLRSLTLFILAMLVPLTAGAANWSGTISTAVTMKRTQSPHNVTSTLTIASGGTLTIEAGSTVKFSPGALLDVQAGKVIALGTSGKRIVIGFNGTNGTHGSWPGIRFRNGGVTSQSVLKFVSLSYGGTATEGAIWLDRTSPTISNVSITHSAGPGILVNGNTTYTLSAITAENCLGDGIVVSGWGSDVLLDTSSIVRNNGGNGIDLRAGAKLRINGLTASNNTGWAIAGEPGTTVTSVATLTMSGNGGGTKNALGTRAGTVSSSVTWTANSALPRYVAGVVTIASGANLTIPPQTVRFDAAAALEVQGTLTSAGTASTPIILTTSAPTPAPGGWGGVRFRTGASFANTLTYTTISYATTGLLFDSWSGTFTNLTIASSSLEGIKVQGVNTQPTLNTVSVTNALSDAIYIATGARVAVNGGTFTGNQGYAFAVDQATPPLTITGVTPPASGGDFKNAIRFRPTVVTSADTWPSQPLPWVITQSLNVQPGASLTLPAGTTIRVAPNQSLIVQGALVTNGTSTQPVRFTSNQPTPAAGDWANVQLTPVATTRLTQTIIEYGGRATVAVPALSVASSSPQLTAVTVQSSYGDGVYVSNAAITGERLTVLNSAGRAVHVADAASRLTLPNSRFEGNAQGIQFTAGLPVVDLRLTYWGHSSGPAGSGPGSGQPVPDGLVYEPWLVAAPSPANFFLSVTATGRTFNPEAGQAARLDHTEQLASTWTLGIYDGLTLIRTLTGSTAYATWDGKNDGGTVQPNGTYRWELGASAAGGNATSATGLAIIDTTTPVIQSFSLSESYISPNADATKDSTTVSASIFGTGFTWTLELKTNPGGTVVRSASGATPAISFVWDGTNDAAVLQPEGAYTAVLTVTKQATNVTQTLPVDIDITPPTAVITAPLENAFVSNVYTAGTSVRATAQDAHLSGWLLEAGPDEPPTSLTTVSSGTWSLVNQSAGTWGSATLAVGRYTLRLTVTDRAGNRTITDRHVDKRDFSATQSGLSGSAVWEFDPDVTTMSYRSVIPFTMRETIRIKNEAGTFIRTLVNNVERTEGTYHDLWDGRNDQGQRVPDGAYFYVASVNTGTGSYTWDRSATWRSGPAVLRIGTAGQLAPFDNRPLAVTYELLAPQKVRLEAANPWNANDFGSPCTAVPPSPSCLEQKYRRSGSHTFPWAGTAADGTFFAEGRAIRATCDNFPENATVVYGSEPQVGALAITPPLMHPPAGASLGFDLALDPGVTATMTVTLIRHANGAILRTITVSGISGGHVQLSIDGRTENGLWLPPGDYTLAITITDSIGNVVKRHALMTARY